MAWKSAPKSSRRPGVATLLLLLVALSLLPQSLAFYQPSEADRANQVAQAQENAAVEQSTGMSKSTVALLHGIVMWLALGALLPFGILAANWSESGKTAVWMHTHWMVQVLAALMAMGSTVAAVLYLWHPSSTSVHGVLGFLGMAALAVQLLQGCLLHCPVPVPVRAIMVNVHKVWAPLVFVLGSAAIISGLLNLASFNGQGLVAVSIVCAIQGVWTVTVVAAILYLSFSVPEGKAGVSEPLKAPPTAVADVEQGKGAKTPKGAPTGIQWTPHDIDGPLAASWQCQAQEEGSPTKWEKVRMG